MADNEAERSAIHFISQWIEGLRFTTNNNDERVPAASSSSSVPSQIAVFAPPSKKHTSQLKPIGTTTYINYRRQQSGRSWSDKAPDDCFIALGYYQAEVDTSENLKQSWMHHAFVAAFGFVTMGRVIRFEGQDVKITLKDDRVRISDYKEPHSERRVTGELDLVFYDVQRQRYFFIDVKTVHSLKMHDLSDAVLKMRVAQQMRVYALLMRWKYNLEYLPDAYVLGVHLNDHGKTGYWKLNNDPNHYSWNTLEEALLVQKK